MSVTVSAEKLQGSEKRDSGDYRLKLIIKCWEKQPRCENNHLSHQPYIKNEIKLKTINIFKFTNLQ